MKIEAYFSGIKAANKAVEQLKNAGLKEAVADLNDHYIVDNNPGTNRPGTDIGARNLSSYVLNTDESLNDPRKGPLLAASPMVSGMGGFEEIADVNYRVTVTVEEDNADKARQILAQSGGDLRDPNFKMPKGLSSISTDEVVERLISDMDEDK